MTMLQADAVLLASVRVTVGFTAAREKLLQLFKETGMSICDLCIKPFAVSLMPYKSFSLTLEGMLRLQVGVWVSTEKAKLLKDQTPFISLLL